MELENFDLSLHFVALGMRCAFVPRHASSIFARKHRLQRIPLAKPLSRTLIVARPRFAKTSEHVDAFADGILFS
jgi:DNA-binding transcriptional LysR family regulator